MEVLKAAHIERIASALGESTRLSDKGTVWGSGEGPLSRAPELRPQQELELLP